MQRPDPRLQPPRSAATDAAAVASATRPREAGQRPAVPRHDRRPLLRAFLDHPPQLTQGVPSTHSPEQRLVRAPGADGAAPADPRA